MKALITTTFVTLLALSVTRAATDPAREQKLQQAIDLIESKGELAAATPLLEETAKSADRALAARALLYLAQAQERAGQGDALATYKRVVSAFGGSPQAATAEAVAVAQAKVTDLTPGRSGPGASPGAITERLVMTTSGFGVRLDSVTPDGRFGVGADESNGDLVVRDMATGAVTRLLKGTLNPRTVGGPGEEGLSASSAVMSPDEKQVAFTWYGEPGNSDGQLWVVPNQPGGTPRPVMKNPAYDDAEPLAWSADERSVFAWLGRSSQPSQLAWISVLDGAVRIIKSAEPGLGFTQPRLSPDGRYIAYARRTRASSPGQSIFVLAADGSGSEVAVTQTTGVNNSPVWTPDGRHVLFVSDRTGSFDLWAVPVREGKTDGAQMLIKKNVGPIDAVGMTRTGSLYYHGVVGNPIDSILIARSERDSWIPSNDLGTTGVAARWSPDGTTLAFARTRPDPLIHTYNVMIKRLDTGEERILAQDHPFVGTGPKWLPDGKGLLALTYTSSTQRRANSMQVAHLDATGQSATRLLFPFDQGNIGLLDPEPARDGGSIYVGGPTPKAGRIANATRCSEATNCLVKLDLETQDVDELAPLPNDSAPAEGGRIRVSPDGSSLAFIIRDRARAHVMTVNANGGKPREVFSDLSAAISALAWTRDGRGLLLSRRQDANRWQLIRVDVETGAVQPTTTAFDRRLGAIDLAPDGLRIAIVTRAYLSETKVLDNVLSALK